MADQPSASDKKNTRAPRVMWKLSRPVTDTVSPSFPRKDSQDHTRAASYKTISLVSSVMCLMFGSENDPSIGILKVIISALRMSERPNLHDKLTPSAISIKLGESITAHHHSYHFITKAF
ncbi:uncharacterized protein PADG_11808 [Paracoccidioides brasiliensis Pb18]|uniref:Uncharacterized protein n=1 Tax=Paracoccidioides brasiliensis (strain Pb18) TaxID=502780 RepID=A0A0A0HVF1_PARBD|nr:uncharacterized protein PADG_11808 [Paracoccidioides brasiliensis Pb18]KGM92021.1 hypothetical protein PADG_11808 [Paracoccidioides brasiliensis Pb18]